MKRLLTNAFMGSWILLTAVLSAGGCGHGSGSVTIPAPKTASNCTFLGETYQSGDAMFNQCCDASGAVPVPLANAPAVCTPGYGGANITGDGFTNAGANALTLAGNAQTLGEQQGALAGNNQSAATASPLGTGAHSNGGQNSGSANGLPPGTGGISSASAGGTGGGGASGSAAGADSGSGGSSGFGAGMGGSGGLSAAAPMPSGPQEFNTPDGGSLYGSGSGSGGGAGGGAMGGRGGSGGSSGSGFDLASLLGGGSGAGAGAGKGGAAGKDLKFGRNPAGDGTGSANGSADPDMYFSLLQPEDNIFKVVERRYQNKQQQWSLADAQKAAAHVTAKP